MDPIPWSQIESWQCIGCGICCKDYHVVLDFNEWINIVKKYGIETTIPSVSKLFLSKKSDGSCCFLSHFGNSNNCTLQYMKPLACKIWPFKIFNSPKFGRAREAIFRYPKKDFFVYVDPTCVGLHWGKPNINFKHMETWHG